MFNTVLCLFVCGLLVPAVESTIKGWTAPELDTASGSYEHKTDIPEDTAIDSGVFTVVAVDESDASTGITYSLITQSTADAFQISTTGEISVKTKLDYETVKSHTLEVEAKETADNTQTGTATITFNIGNVGRPVFEKSSETICVQQGTSEGTEIIKITATVEGGGQIAYTFVPGDTPNELFDIVSTTGAVTVKTDQTLDKAESYTLTVQAIADMEPATKELKINVGDCSSASLMTSLSLVMLLVTLLVSMN